MDPVVHFQIPAQDRQRMRNFYETVFGWKTNQLGKDMGEYVLVTTTETDENRMVTKPGTINGGFFQKTDAPMSQYPSIVIQVEDINESIRKVEKAGGKLFGEISEMPQIGTFATFIDSEGNQMTMMQAKNPVH
jgi:predicted enzyme related to lactoylglutathione lyase